MEEKKFIEGKDGKMYESGSKPRVSLDRYSQMLKAYKDLPLLVRDNLTYGEFMLCEILTQ